MGKINVLFEDENIIAVDKPAGVLAYPLPGSSEKTIGEMVGAVPAHRLDRDTSGVMLLAKNEEAKLKMQKIFAERKIEKRYSALLWGKVEPEAGEIRIPLGRGSKDRLRVVADPSGRESHTIYKVKKYYPKSDVSLVEVEIKTGRTHQIRVHFASIGHPVVGDKKYTGIKTGPGRQFLHAERLELASPFTGKKIALHAELPEDLKEYLGTLS